MKTGGCYQKKKSNQEPDEILSCQKRLFRGQTGMEQAWREAGRWGGGGIREFKQKLLFESLVHVSVEVAGTSLKGVILRELSGPLRQSCGLISYCDCNTAWLQSQAGKTRNSFTTSLLWMVPHYLLSPISYNMTSLFLFNVSFLYW